MLSTKQREHASEPGGETVFEQMHEIMFLFRSLLQQRLREDGGEIPGMALKVLGFFARHPGRTQRELVQHSGRDKGQVARLVKDLTERGLLQRSDATAGRRRVLELTDSGLVLHRRLQRQRSQLANKLIAGLSAHELAQLNRLLGKLKAPLLA
jgi:DNA-binding MarR family transcriptional regulator